MKQFLTLSFILILLACSNQKETTSIKIKPNEHVLIDTVNESKYCYIKSVKQIENEIYIKVDYVEYLTGDQATNQAFKEKAYFIDGTDTILDIQNGYYISNQNSKLRQFKVAKSATYQHIIDDDGKHQIKNTPKSDTTQLNNFKNSNALIIVHVKNGIIRSIDERFIP